MSDKDVLSRVPQGTVLTLIFFIIMISYTDTKSRENDTRVSTMKGAEADQKEMQKDFDTIYKWA